MRAGREGFKGGGFDPRGLSTAAPDLNGNGAREPAEIFDYFLFDPEKVTSYEIGYKANPVRPPPAPRHRRLLRRL